MPFCLVIKRFVLFKNYFPTYPYCGRAEYQYSVAVANIVLSALVAEPIGLWLQILLTIMTENILTSMSFQICSYNCDGQYFYNMWVFKDVLTIKTANILTICEFSKILFWIWEHPANIAWSVLDAESKRARLQIFANYKFTDRYYYKHDLRTPSETKNYVGKIPL